MSKIWGGLWHMSEDGIARKCYASNGNCRLGYHSDSEAGSYNKFNDDPMVVKVKLPSLKRKLPQLSAENKGRRVLMSKYGVTQNLQDSESEQISSYTNNEVVAPGHTIRKEAVIFALNHKTYENVTLEKTTDSREYLIINGRKRYLDKQQIEIMNHSRKRFDSIQSRVASRDRHISEIHNSSNASVMLKTGKSKKELIKLIEAGRREDIAELSRMSRNYGHIYTENYSTVRATLSNGDGSKKRSLDVGGPMAENFSSKNNNEFFVKNILQLFTNR